MEIGKAKLEIRDAVPPFARVEAEADNWGDETPAGKPRPSKTKNARKMPALRNPKRAWRHKVAA